MAMAMTMAIRLCIFGNLKKNTIVFCYRKYLIFLHFPSQNMCGCLTACLYYCVPSLQIQFDCTGRKAKVRVVNHVFLDYRLEPTLSCQVVEKIKVSYFSATKAAQGIELQNNLEWNTSKPGGWEAYKQAGEISAVELCRIAEEEGYSSEEVNTKVEKIHEKMKWTAFGKTKPRTKKAASKEYLAGGLARWNIIHSEIRLGLLAASHSSTHNRKHCIEA